MGQVMFCIAAALLGFQAIVWTLIFGSALTSRPFLPRFPYNLASEIRFLHASSALSDIAGTADMSSAMRSIHLKRLESTYGYRTFRGLDGERHLGIESTSLIMSYKEAVVTTSASSTIQELARMVYASPSPPPSGWFP